MLKDERLAAKPIVPVLIVTYSANMPDEHTELPETILLDAERKSFGIYQVAVMPSVVIVDGQGRVVHAMASLSARFSNVLTDTLLLATGQLTPEQFQQRLHPPASAQSDEQRRAQRISQLAAQLAPRLLFNQDDA